MKKGLHISTYLIITASNGVCVLTDAQQGQNVRGIAPEYCVAGTAVPAVEANAVSPSRRRRAVFSIIYNKSDSLEISDFL